MMVSSSKAADEDIYFSSLPVVATVSRLPQSLADAPGSVTVIERDMIRQSGARQVSDLMRLVPGFFVTPANQDAPRVVYHGLSNETNSPRVQVLIDGRSQYSPLFQSGVNWNVLPVAIDDIERIEISRGSNSASYGSNAFLGVINIITIDPAQAKGTSVALNHGNQSIRDQTVRWGGRVGSADVRLTYQQQGDDGLKLMENSGQWIDPHDSRHAKLFDLRANLFLNDRDEVQMSLSQASDISQFGRPSSTTDPFHDSSQSSTSINFGWRRVISTDEELRLRFSRVEDWGSESYLTSGGFRYDLDKGGKSETNDFELQHSLGVGQGIRMVWGVGLRGETMRSISQFFTSAAVQRQTGRVFGNAEWRPSTRWILNAGANFEHSSIGGTIFDPRASASYHMLPGHTIRLVASRAHRMPNFFEVRGDLRAPDSSKVPPFNRRYLAAEGVKPERVDTLEVSYLGEFKNLRASLDIRGFYERIPNRIQWFPYALSAANRDGVDQDPLYYPYGRADTFLNNERVSIRGYEYQLRWQPFDSTRLMYSHAFINISAELLNESLIAENPPNSSNVTVAKIPDHTRYSAPRHSSSAMLVQQLPFGLEASLMYYKQGYMRWTRNTSISPYERVDWRLAYPFKFDSIRGEIAYTAYASNGSHDGLRSSRIVTETHWLTLRLDL